MIISKHKKPSQLARVLIFYCVTSSIIKSKYILIENTKRSFEMSL